MHLILGDGNLGVDLAEALRRDGRKAFLLAKKDFYWQGVDSHPTSMRELVAMRPEVVWCAVGAGGPGGSALRHFNSHVALPLALAEWAPKLICFSTSYLNNDPEGRLSDYAMSKAMMERALEKRENVRCLRVGSLYGAHYPMKCLPGKMVKAFIEGKLTKGAINKITPTSTAWLAAELVRLEAWEQFSQLEPGTNVAPSGWTTPKDWIEQIIREYTGEGFTAKLEPFMCEDYPGDASGGSRLFGDDWFFAWEHYGPAVLRAARGELRALSKL